jgi:hypothetical protein
MPANDDDWPELLPIRGWSRPTASAANRVWDLLRCAIRGIQRFWRGGGDLVTETGGGVSDNVHLGITVPPPVLTGLFSSKPDLHNPALEHTTSGASTKG